MHVYRSVPQSPQSPQSPATVTKRLKPEAEPSDRPYQQIYEREKNKKLAMRTIVLETVRNNERLRTMREQDYLCDPLPAPRPAT